MYLGVDVGTSSCKAVLVNEAGKVLAHASVAYPTNASADTPHVLLRTCLEALGSVNAKAARRINAIGVCGRGTGIVFLDESGGALEFNAAQLRKQLGSTTVPDLIRYPKLYRWGQAVAAARSLVADGFTGLRVVLGVKDYVNHQLTGMTAIDTFSATCREWPETVEAEYGLDPDVLPAIRKPWEVLGTTTDWLEREFGVPSNTPVVVGGHDGVCANLGSGLIGVGEGCLTLGTRGVVRVNTREPVLNGVRFTGFTYPYLDSAASWVGGGDVPSCGSSVAWLMRILEPGFLPRTSAELFAAMDSVISCGSPEVRQPMFLPYLAGEESPSSNPDARGVLSCLDLGHGRQDLGWALLEGITFALYSISEAHPSLKSATADLALTGGGASSSVWPRIIATVFSRSIRIMDEEVSAIGAAMLAAVGFGAFGSPEAASESMCPAGRLVDPVPDWKGVMDERYRRFIRSRSRWR